MTTPIIEHIAANIETTIDLITTDNGWNQTLTSKRPTAVDYKNAAWDDLDVLISQVNGDEDEGPLNVKTRNQHFDIMAIALNSESSSVTIDTRLNAIFADIEKKLMEDETRGTYAIDTTIHNPTFFKDNAGGLTGVNIDISIQYRTVLTDPYTQG